MASLHELLCYHSLEQLDPGMEEFLTFIQTTLSSLHSFPATSTVLPETTDDNFNLLQKLRQIFHTKFGMCNPKITKYFPRGGLVKALEEVNRRKGKPVGRSCSLQAQEAAGFRQGAHPLPENGFRPTVYRKSKLLPRLHCEGEPSGEECIKFKQKHLTGLGQDHRFPAFSIKTD